jgi:LL-diaminopimelate aminotransferase
MEHLQPGVFARLATKKRARLERGESTIDLSIGTPNIPPAPHILESLAMAVMNKSNYAYAIRDLNALRNSAANWYERRFNVLLDPGEQVVGICGAQDGLAHIAFSIIDPGDLVLVPTPCYPAFFTGPQLAGARLHYMPQRKGNGYIIDLDEIPRDIARQAKLMIVSYPNNPTTAVVPDSFYDHLVAFAKKHDIIILHDNCYSELVFDGQSGGSFLSHEGAIKVGVEFNSLSKPYGLAGARIGFCLGNREICRNLELLKSNIDYGFFLPIQMAAISALDGDQSCVAETRAAYQSRRDVLCDGLCELGWQVPRSKATIFVWSALPKPYVNSEEFCDILLEKSGVLVAPGSAFGQMGEGHVRFALSQDEKTLRAAVEAIDKSGVLTRRK